MRKPLQFAAVIGLATAMLGARAQEQGQDLLTAGEKTYVVPVGTVLRVTLAAPFKPAHLKSGDQIEGHLNRAIYSYDRQVIPVGTRFHATVSEVSKHREAPAPPK